MVEVYRASYVEQLNALRDKHIISLLVGLRRVGKSTIMQQFAAQSDVDPQKVLWLPLERFEYLSIRHADALTDYLRAQNVAQMEHLLIDEIQLVDGRAEVINGLHASYPALNIILTGSNSDLLSSEIATSLRGRVYQIYVYPFDLAEYRCYHDHIQHTDEREQATRDTLRQVMSRFLCQTGLPIAYGYDDQAYVIQELINTVFLKDVVERYHIKDVDVLRSILAFLVSNTGNITNLSKIASALTSYGYSINLNTIGNYVDYLKNSLLIHECPLYDIRGKKVFTKLRKFYPADHGLRNYLFSRADVGTGKQLENYMYLQLRKHGYHVYVGRDNEYEIDFVAEKQTKKIYMQVAWSLDSEGVYEREFGNLQRIRDTWPKYVVSMDETAIGSIDAIQHLQARHLDELWDH